MRLDLSRAVSEILQEYGKEVKDDINASLKEVAQQTVEKLKTRQAKYHKGNKRYNKGWSSADEVTFAGQTMIIFNKTKPQLTHLLNDGHEYVTRTGRRVKEIKGDHHIDDAEDFANALLIQKVEEKLK